MLNYQRVVSVSGDEVAMLDMCTAEELSRPSSMGDRPAHYAVTRRQFPIENGIDCHLFTINWDMIYHAWYLSIYRSIYLSIDLSIDLSIYLSTYLWSGHPPRTYLSCVYIYTYAYIYIFLNLMYIYIYTYTLQFAVYTISTYIWSAPPWPGGYL